MKGSMWKAAAEDAEDGWEVNALTGVKCFHCGGNRYKKDCPKLKGANGGGATPPATTPFAPKELPNDGALTCSDGPPQELRP